MIWDTYKDFSSEFLNKHHDYVLYDVAHRIKAFLLYPPNCSCDGVCQCESLREKIVLSLNMDLLNQSQAKQISPDQLNAMKMIFKIPDDSYFKAHYTESYPIWLIKERLNQEDRKKNFKIVEKLVWGLLRLAKTYELSVYKEPRASINEAVEMIVGDIPLRTKTKKLDREPSLCGEKGYGVQLNIYKSVCHFLAAYEHMKEKNSSFSLNQPEHIEAFLSLSYWIRNKLLKLKTPNIKENSLFADKTLLSFPAWVNSEDIHVSIEPFEHKLQKINTSLKKLA